MRWIHSFHSVLLWNIDARAYVCSPDWQMQARQTFCITSPVFFLISTSHERVMCGYDVTPCYLYADHCNAPAEKDVDLFYFL